MNKSESKYFNTAVKMDKALLELLGKKDFEYITVKEICDKAQVNRSTFYLHYENTRDLLSETLRYLIDNFLTYFTQKNPSTGKFDISTGFQTLTLSELNFISEKYLYPYLSYIKENRQIFSTALKHADSFEFDKVYQRMFQHIFNPILERFLYPEKEREYIMIFYLNGIHAIISKWIQNDCNDSMEYIAGIITDCILGKNNSKLHEIMTPADGSIQSGI